MINVQQITSQLARLPDQALQQYAQMHKNDPYIMALALSESNRRKQMREGAQMAAPEQPKVVDQEIANMAAPMPEDVGIAQLPAGEMEFADGGIVAFDEGGSVERYQDRGLVRPGPGVYAEDPRLAREALNRARLYKDLSRLGIPPSVVSAGFEAAGAAGPAAALGLIPAGMAYGLTSAMQEMRDQGYPTDPMGEFSSGAVTPAQAAFDEDRRQRLLREQAQRKAEEARYSALVEGREPPKPTAPATAAASPASPDADFPSAARTRAAPSVDTTGTRPAAPAAAASAAPAAGLSDLQSLYSNILARQDYKDPAAARLAELETKERTAAQEEKAALERDQARFAEAFKGREARLSKREAEIGTYKDTNTGLALLNAGLAIMSTPGGLATALGKGAQVGTAQFAAGLDKIRSAQEKLDEARDRMEELKLNRDEMNAKEIRAAENKIRQVGIEAEKRGIDGLRQAGQINREAAKSIFDKTVQVGITREEIAGRARVAAALPQELRGAMLLGTGETDAEKLRSGIPALMELKDRMTDTKIAELYTKHVADAKKELQTPMTPEDFAKTIRSAMSAYRPTVANVENTRPR